MNLPVRLASFCRLCLSKTKDKVPVFADGDMLESLLHLIEIQIDPKVEPDAVVCYDCVVTLEGFHQFKEQCHVNDEFVKTVPSKPECSSSSIGEAHEEEEDEDNETGLVVEDNIEEEDRLELSEAEEVFQERPRRKTTRTYKKNSPANGKKNSPKKQPEPSPNIKIPLKKKQGDTSKKPTLDELQVLADSYPDYFYFEKGSRSIYYTLVFYGERYNSALFNERNTYWQCVHRRKYQCPAQVWATNDYKSFERRLEHSHGTVREKEGEAFTPREALPEIFQICKRIVEQKRARNMKQETSFEDKFRDFAVDTKSKSANDEIEDRPDEQDESDEHDNTTADDSSEEAVSSEVRSKRKRKPNTRYSDGANLTKKRADEPETKSRKQTNEENKIDKAKVKRERMKSESESIDVDGADQEDETAEEEDLDLEKIEQECEALNVPRKPPSGPPLEDQLVLADSYPDYFFFEKGPRSIYYTMVYYGERFNSAMFTENYTYWQCQHRRKYKCPAQVCVTNNYKNFERRYEHTHPELQEKEGQPFTPLEALPEVFEACRKVVLKNRAKRRKKLLEKHKYLRSINATKSRKRTPKPVVKEEAPTEIEDDEVVVYDVLSEDDMDKEVEYVEDFIEESED